MTAITHKTAFVTGGGSGVGYGQAYRLLEAGCKVAIADIREDHLQEAVDKLSPLGGSLLPVVLDITDPYAYLEAADRVEDELGPVQLLFNTAGVSHFGPLRDATLEDWQWQLNVNLIGVINGVQTFLPRMMERSEDECHITTTASMSAFMALPTTGIYCATKMAVRGYVETLALELKESHIGVSMLCPGAVNTNIHEAVLTRPKHLSNTGYYGKDETVFEHLKKVIQIGMEPETLAAFTLEGIERDQLYILPYPEFKQALEDGHRKVMASLALPEDDPEYEKRVAYGVPGGK